MLDTLYHLEDRDFFAFFVSSIISCIARLVVINDTVLHDDCHDNIEKKQSDRARATISLMRLLE